MTLIEAKRCAPGTAARFAAATAPLSAPEERTALSSETGFGRRSFLQTPFDTIAADEVVAVLRQREAGDAFAYVVTPNVDHIVRLARRPDLMPTYRAAWISCCDSHPLRALARLVKLQLPHMAGADLVERIFAEVLCPADRVVCIVADEALIDELSARYPEYEFVGYSPPMGFDKDPHEMATCVRFIRERPARFVFLGVGSPRSEQLAHAVQQNSDSTGTALCIGAALEFLVGRKRRAPRAMRGAGMEWLHRLVSEPRRLWRRYTFAVVPLCVLFLREVLTRRRA